MGPGHLLLVALAGLLDARFGDPPWRLHPVRLIGDLSNLSERLLFALGARGRGGGLLHWLLVVGGALVGWGLVHLALAGLGRLDTRLAGPGAVLAWCWDLALAYSLLCTRDLLDHGQQVLAALPDLPAARARLQRLVGRDTDGLGRGGIVRASIESLAENLTDGVLTPLWALALGGLPGLVLVKAASTLDSMVGYRTPRYLAFGWASARADDLIHWLPARLSVPLIALAAALTGGHPRDALVTAWREHGRLPSPNSGWSEAACAGALRVRLLGPIRRRGQLVNSDYLGAPDWPADLEASDLRQALRLIAVAAAIALMLALLLAAGMATLIAG
ncbi:MAG: cobalamin biosynthesis protein CobD [Chromatiaceae bacterium]|nr:MAG: cobalamin biosynthesis protein CobD [Chromatiaceae bacterium]